MKKKIKGHIYDTDSSDLLVTVERKSQIILRGHKCSMVQELYREKSGDYFMRYFYYTKFGAKREFQILPLTKTQAHDWSALLGVELKEGK